MARIAFTCGILSDTVTSRAFVAIGVMLAATALLAQDVLFRSDVSLVRMDVQVTGSAGGIQGLTKNDFTVRDNEQHAAGAVLLAG